MSVKNTTIPYDVDPKPAVDLFDFLKVYCHKPYRVRTRYMYAVQIWEIKEDAVEAVKRPWKLLISNKHTNDLIKWMNIEYKPNKDNWPDSFTQYADKHTNGLNTFRNVNMRTLQRMYTTYSPGSDINERFNRKSWDDQGDLTYWETYVGSKNNYPDVHIVKDDYPLPFTFPEYIKDVFYGNLRPPHVYADVYDHFNRMRTQRIYPVICKDSSRFIHIWNKFIETPRVKHILTRMKFDWEGVRPSMKSLYLRQKTYRIDEPYTFYDIDFHRRTLKKVTYNDSHVIASDYRNDISKLNTPEGNDNWEADEARY